MNTTAAVGTLIDGRYRILSELGEGAFATVYSGLHVETETLVALKVVNAELSADKIFLSRFKREARLMQRLKHPNIVQIYHCGFTAEKHPYMAMQLLEGTTLREMMLAHRNFSMEEIGSIISQIAQGLTCAHKNKILHRDLKPENIILVADGDSIAAKIIDFGLAKSIEPDMVTMQDKTTRTGIVVGTPAYMSPEQCEGKVLDERSDIYALGCILHELLTGSPPYVAESSFAIMYKHKHDPVPSPRLFLTQSASAIEVGLAVICANCLQKLPADRYQTTEAIGESIDQLIKNGLQPVKTRFGGNPRIEARRVSLVLAAVISIGLLVAGIYFQFHRELHQTTGLPLGTNRSSNNGNTTGDLRSLLLDDYPTVQKTKILNLWFAKHPPHQTSKTDESDAFRVFEQLCKRTTETREANGPKALEYLDLYIAMSGHMASTFDIWPSKPHSTAVVLNTQILESGDFEVVIPWARLCAVKVPGGTEPDTQSYCVGVLVQTIHEQMPKFGNEMGTRRLDQIDQAFKLLAGEGIYPIEALRTYINYYAALPNRTLQRHFEQLSLAILKTELNAKQSLTPEESVSIYGAISRLFSVDDVAARSLLLKYGETRIADSATSPENGHIAVVLGLAREQFIKGIHAGSLDAAKAFFARQLPVLAVYEDKAPFNEMKLLSIAADQFPRTDVLMSDGVPISLLDIYCDYAGKLTIEKNFAASDRVLRALLKSPVNSLDKAERHRWALFALCTNLESGTSAQNEEPMIAEAEELLKQGQSQLENLPTSMIPLAKKSQMSDFYTYRLKRVQAKAAVLKGRPDEALSILRSCDSLSTNCEASETVQRTYALLNLAKAYREKRNWTKSIACLDELLKPRSVLQTRNFLSPDFMNYLTTALERELKFVSVHEPLSDDLKKEIASYNALMAKSVSTPPLTRINL